MDVSLPVDVIRQARLVDDLGENSGRLYAVPFKCSSIVSSGFGHKVVQLFNLSNNIGVQGTETRQIEKCIY
jgi:hypothetical protein